MSRREGPVADSRWRSRVDALWRLTAAGLLGLTCVVILDAGVSAVRAAARPAPADPAGGSAAAEKCQDCHSGLEEMHPWYAVTCTGCHGGNPDATEIILAHVRETVPLPNDERILPESFDPKYLQFLNPADLRVVRRTCGACHGEIVERLLKSLHCTTAGHLSDGLYENGLARSRRTRFSIFAVEDADGKVPENAYASLAGLPSSSSLPGDRSALSGHVLDLARKNCMQCHLWSSGTGLRGRLGQDGDYRGGGCTACHVSYADDGLSKSADRSIDRLEPGHPIEHRMVKSPPTNTCTRCHYGDASIGLQFRGLAQLVPGMPAGPQVPGTTDSRLNGAYYIDDPLIVPPDIHHEKGMHCVDCHTTSDVMGDGNVYGFMEHAVEIECTDCHGTFTQTTARRTSRGQRLEHIVEEEGKLFLVSKVDGRRHPLKQAFHVLDPKRAEYNPVAARAMTEAHEKLECYACHAGWNANFFGFHFDRNESFSDLDLLSGERTPGRNTTQEKVFATLRHFYLGYNDEGMVAPYLVGFSTMGSVHDAQGKVFVDQLLPVTAAGLSGMTMIHHQLHSTRPVARDCVDCHRSPGTLGLGSGNFNLTRGFGAVVDDRGLHIVALDRENPELSAPIACVPLPRARRVAARCDELQGFFEYLFVALEGAGVAVIDARSIAAPRTLRVIPTDDARDVLYRAGLLYVADGGGGLKIFDVRDVDKTRLVGAMPSREARSLDLCWPHVYLADGPAGVNIVDVSEPARPDFIAHLDVLLDSQVDDDVEAVRVTFQSSRPDDGYGERTPSRKLAVIANGAFGPAIFDVTEPKEALRLFPHRAMEAEGSAILPDAARGRLRFRDVCLTSRFDLGSEGGEIPTEENDYAYFAVEDVSADDGGAGALWVVRISDPENPKRLDSERLESGAAKVALLSCYNAPFLQRFAVIAGRAGAVAVDLSRSDKAEVLGPVFAENLPVHDVVFESFSFDRMVDESGRQLKDISHEGARFFTKKEVDRLLGVTWDLRSKNVKESEGSR